MSTFQLNRTDDRKIVWVADGAADYSKGLAFGQPVFLTGAIKPRWNVLPEELTSKLIESHVNDFLFLNGGDGLLAAHAIAIWFTLHPHLNIILADGSCHGLTKNEVLLRVEAERDRREATAKATRPSQRMVRGDSF